MPRPPLSTHPHRERHHRRCHAARVITATMVMVMVASGVDEAAEKATVLQEDVHACISTISLGQRARE